MVKMQVMHIHVPVAARWRRSARRQSRPNSARSARWQCSLFSTAASEASPRRRRRGRCRRRLCSVCVGIQWIGRATDVPSCIPSVTMDVRLPFFAAGRASTDYGDICGQKSRRSGDCQSCRSRRARLNEVPTYENVVLLVAQSKICSTINL